MEDFEGAFRVGGVEDADGFAGVVAGGGVGILDIDVLGGEQFEEFGERSRVVVHLDGDDLADDAFGAEGGEDLSGGLEVVGDEPQDAAFAAIHDADGLDIDLLVGQGGADFGEAARLVFEIGRDLVEEFHRIASFFSVLEKRTGIQALRLMAEDER